MHGWMYVVHGHYLSHLRGLLLPALRHLGSARSHLGPITTLTHTDLGDGLMGHEWPAQSGLATVTQGDSHAMPYVRERNTHMGGVALLQ